MKELEKQVEVQSFLATLLSKFVSLPPEDFEGLAKQALGEIGQYFKADRAYILNPNAEGSSFSRSLQWLQNESASASEEGPALSERFPLLAKSFRDFHHYYIADTSRCSRKERSDCENLKKDGVASIFGVPVVLNRKLVGALLIDWTTKRAELSDEDLLLLKNVMKTLAGFHSSKYSDDQLRQMSTAIDQSPLSVLITTLDGIIEYVNPKFTLVTGYTREEVLGKTPRILNSGEQNREFYENLWQTIIRGETWRGTFHNRRRDGSLFWEDSSIGPIRNKDGEITHYLAFKEDISDQIQSEQRFRTLFRQNEMLLDSFPGILILLDNAERILRWNEEAERVFGRKEKDVQLFSIRSVFNSPDTGKILARIMLCGESKRRISLEDIKYTRPDRKMGLLNMNVTPLLRGSTDIEAYLITGEDVTEKRLTEEKLRQSLKLESIGQLAAGIAHEINTPAQFVGDNIYFLEQNFRNIFAFLDRVHDSLRSREDAEAQILLEKMKVLDLDFLSTEIPKALEQSREGIVRVGKIVRAMKEFSHPGQKEKMMTDINRAVENTVIVTRNAWKYDAELELKLDENLRSVSCLPDKFNQALLNIIINAADAIRDMRNGKGPMGKITIRTGMAGDMAEVRISDTGPGIPENIQERIFDPFFTTKDVGKGTGQGLAIAYDYIVNKHDGAILLDSEEGRGSSFIIRIPAGSDLRKDKL